MAAEYFLLIFLTGALESLRESFLTVFGQKMTHSFRSELSDKLVRLSADTLNKEEPGAVVSRLSAMLTPWKRCLPPGSSVCSRMHAESSAFLR